MQNHSHFLHEVSRCAANKGDPHTLQSLAKEIKDWPTLVHRAELYAVATQLAELNSEFDLEVPKPVSLGLRALIVRHRAASKARYQVMQELLPLFAQEGVPVVALKGLALAPLIYAKDYLRPMRDIDLLVPKHKLLHAADLLRSLGFDLPMEHSNKFMRYSNQLPGATKVVNGFSVSIELHHDCLARDVKGHLQYGDVSQQLQTVRWRELELLALGHEQMLHHLCRHLEDAQPGAVLKLINVLDIVLYAETHKAQINWAMLKQHYAHVLNTLKCLQMIVPLSKALQGEVGEVSQASIAGVGETALSMRAINAMQAPFSTKLKLLFLPPDWWLHLFYNIDPRHTLFFTKFVSHPIHLFWTLLKRMRSLLFGR